MQKLIWCNKLRRSIRQKRAFILQIKQKYTWCKIKSLTKNNKRLSKTNSWALKLAENSLDGINAPNNVLKQLKPAKHEWTDASYSKRPAAHSLTAVASGISDVLAQYYEYCIFPSHSPVFSNTRCSFDTFYSFEQPKHDELNILIPSASATLFE
jgi:hypothetical protein